jgi:hypothetical protein
MATLIRIVDLIRHDDPRIHFPDGDIKRSTGHCAVQSFHMPSAHIMLGDDGMMYYHTTYPAHRDVVEAAMEGGGIPFLIRALENVPLASTYSGFEDAGPAPSLDGPQPD